MTAVSRSWYPPGDLGTRYVLARMRDLAHAARHDPLTRRAARAIVQATPLKDREGRAALLRAWLAEHVRFRRDPAGVELLQAPPYQLGQVARHYLTRGDCDDAAILGAALAKQVGLPARFRILGFRSPRAPFVHVVTDVLTPRGWLDLDVTRRAQRFPPAVARMETFPV